jgi:dTDP-4-dehydrorhamnose reductase
MLTMLRLGAERAELRVVDDQHGAPTSAFDIAIAIVTTAKQLVDRPEDESLRGIFHLTSLRETTWAGFAAEIFRLAAERGGSFASVLPILTSQYPTPATRPASSRLNVLKIGKVRGVHPPHWIEALRNVLDRLQSQCFMPNS